jgi:hypothetical protein
MSCTNCDTATRCSGRSYGESSPARASAGSTRPEVPITVAPRLKAFSRRTTRSPVTGKRAVRSIHGIVLPAGSGKAPVLRMTSLSTWSTWSTAQDSAIAPPQSCTTSETGSVSSRVSSHSPRSATRRDSVCG